MPLVELQALDDGLRKKFLELDGTLRNACAVIGDDRNLSIRPARSTST